METIMIEELLKNGVLVTVLALSGYILWRRYDKFTERTQTELTALRSRMEEFLLNDRKIMLEMLNKTNDTMNRQTIATDRNSKVTECLIQEIQEFKEGELYLNHQKTKQHK